MVRCCEDGWRKMSGLGCGTRKIRRGGGVRSEVGVDVL